MNVPVRFGFQDFQSELSSLALVAGSFLQPDAAMIVKEAAQQLEQFQLQGGKYTFSVGQQRPLCSLAGRSFEGSGRKASFDVYGTASWVWEIEAVGEARGRKAKYFDVVGKASTQIRVFRHNSGSCVEIAMWRIELGDLVSPGTYFHTQILGESNSGPFPHSLPVPRLPSILVTPMSAVEYMLSELFQDEWGEHATGDRDALKFWNQIQRRRLRKLLKWKLKQLENNQSSPWVALKRAKPKKTEVLFFGEDD